jgi:hypothetical protein
MFSIACITSVIPEPEAYLQAKIATSQFRASYLKFYIINITVNREISMSVCITKYRFQFIWLCKVYAVT